MLQIFVFNANKTVGPNNLTVSSGQRPAINHAVVTATYTKTNRPALVTILGGCFSKNNMMIGNVSFS